MAYTDLTDEFVTRHLIDWQNFKELADNDAYNRWIPTTATVFFQAAAPAKWTKSTTHDDKALRIVSGAGGGNGGTLTVSGGISLNHSHTVASHTHGVSNHQHAIDTISGTGAAAQTDQLLATDDALGDGAVLRRRTAAAGSQTARVYAMTTATDGGGGSTGGTAPGTDTYSATPVFAYLDMIVCTKD